MNFSNAAINYDFVVETRYGSLHCFENDLISTFIKLYGEWGFFETEFLRQSIQPRRIYDLGAYIGTFSLAMQETKPEYILAVEANPFAYSNLVKNLHANMRVQYATASAAVTIARGAVNGSFIESSNQGSFGITECDDVEAGTRLATRTLRDLREQFGNYDFLKLDIEGSETQAILSDYKWISENSPTIWAECNESGRSISLFSLLLELGYKVFFFRYPAFNPRNYKSQSKKVFPLAFEAGLLAVRGISHLECTESAESAGASVAKISTSDELRRALWLTPRWGRSEWADSTRIELLALLGRREKLDDFNSFLRS